MESSICRSEKRRTDCFDERQSVRFYFMKSEKQRVKLNKVENTEG